MENVKRTALHAAIEASDKDGDLHYGINRCAEVLGIERSEVEDAVLDALAQLAEHHGWAPSPAVHA